MIISTRFPLDILIQFLLCLLLIPIIFIEINDILRILIGLPVLLFIPGYMLTFLLFPTTKEYKGIDSVERFAMSFALSLAIIPIIGVCLNFTPMGLRFIPIFFTLESFIFITGILGIIRWLKTPSSDRFFFSINLRLPNDKDIIDRILTIGLILAIISFIVISTYVLFTPFKSDSFTEFYILNEEENIGNYPTFLGLGENATLKIGIINHEHNTKTYTVEIWLTSQTIEFDEITQENVTKDHMWYLGKTTKVLESTPADINEPWTSQWEYDYTFNISRKGDFKLFFLLFTKETQKYYQNLDYGKISTEIISNAYLINNLTMKITNLPRIYDINASSSSTVQNNFLNISCSIFDIDGLHDVYLNIDGPEHYHENISILNNRTGLQYFCNQTYINPGVYYYYFWTNDITGNSSQSSSNIFTITDIPKILDVWISKNVTIQNTPLNISCLVYDYEGLRDISINLTTPLGETENISIIETRIGFGHIYYLERVYELVGTYNYYIWVRDVVGNTNTSSMNQFLIIPRE